jgi:YHS domain-containing protein
MKEPKVKARRVFVQRTFLAFVFLLLPLAASFAQNDPSAPLRLVLRGHDPVAYFTEGRPVKGSPQLSHDWDGGRYHFASARNRDMFVADPDRYAPQFGGYCTGSMSRGVRNEGNPEAWAIVDGKLYVVGAPDTASALKQRETMQTDREYLALRIPKAEKNWRETR